MPLHRAFPAWMWAGIIALLPLLANASPVAVSVLGASPGQTPEQAMAERLVRGENIQWMVTVMEPAARLDPWSVEVAFDTFRPRVFVYPLNSQQSLVFAARDSATTHPVSRVGLRGRVLDGRGRFSRTYNLPRSSTDATTYTLARDKTPVVRILDQQGQPIRGAGVFGQYRSDLFGIANAEGVVHLTSPNRYTPDPHWVTAPGYWSVPFEPRTTSTVVLEPAPVGLFEGVQSRLAEDFPVPHGRAQLVDDSGRPVAAVLVWANRTWWARTNNRGEFPVVFPPGQEAAELLVYPVDSSPLAVRVERPDDPALVPVVNLPLGRGAGPGQ